MSNRFADQFARRAWVSAFMIFAALSGACGASDAGDDPFTSGPSGGSTSNPGSAGRTGAAGAAVGVGGQFTSSAGSSAGGSASLGGSGGSPTIGSGGAISAGGFGASTGGANPSGGSGGRSFGFGGSGGRSFGSGGSGGRSFGSGGSAGHAGQSSTGGASGTSATWTEIYTKFLTNDQYASNCNGAACHNPGKQKGFDFSSKASGYTSVKNSTSQLVSELSSGGMPRGKPKMPAADLAVIKAWVAAGALDN